MDGHVLELLRVRRLKAGLHKAARRCLREVRRHHSPRAFMARNARLVRAWKRRAAQAKAEAKAKAKAKGRR